MTTIHAKSIIDNKFWIVEEDNQKVGILKLTDQNKYVFSSKSTITTYDTKKKLVEKFGSNFFISSPKTINSTTVECTIYDYPTSVVPYNAIFDVKRHLPLFSKSVQSTSLYCAGYYIIKFDKRWTRAFCPKLITIERYQYEGPFKTELEMKQRLSNVSK